MLFKIGEKGNSRGGLLNVSKAALFLVAGFVFGRMSSFVEQDVPCTYKETTHLYKADLYKETTGDSVAAYQEVLTKYPSSQFWTVGEIKKHRMILPCNFVHDGYYLQQSNEVAYQVFQSLMELDDDIIPFVIEAGGHDGITKSLSLKSSRCFGVNTLLIDASPFNYKVLHKTRAYDRTVHAALCDDIKGTVQMMENSVNSGENKVVSTLGKTKKKKGMVEVQCTSLDAELDKIRDLLPDHQKDKIQLIFLVLDIEGFEAVATKGLIKYRPHKLMMEWKHIPDPKAKEWLTKWLQIHGLVGKKCGTDHCFNYQSMIGQNVDLTKRIFYGARKTHPADTHKTSRASKSYFFYGE